MKILLSSILIILSFALWYFLSIKLNSNQNKEIIIDIKDQDIQISNDLWVDLIINWKKY